MSGADASGSVASGESAALECVQCLYSLEGCAADPCLCPECGYANSLTDVRELGRLVPLELRSFETVATVCAVAFFGICVGMWVVGSISRVAGIVVLGTCVGGWITLVGSFRSICRSRVGWGRVVIRYHLAGLLIVGTLAGVGWGAAACFTRVPRWVSFLAYTVFVVLALTGLWKRRASVVLLAPYNWAKRELDSVCRVVAFDRLRERRGNLA